ncbi:lipopolysaccharide biosynthesis protein [Sphingobacterium corticibacterium]|uniref:Lipopolysaccharide biosynthesis protein n=1 Tax=Sphingobacterium corticibacterium TaxID=2484746 RepID=A0A4Q6XR55_9SPHI|nr:lipopolysaccharide biosynthesis protein [Sphingobacterium corticibacterium]
MMGVSLYTVRVVLDTLGVVDYGLYNVVGGIVIMFSFLSGTMSSASQRFFAFELGRKNHDALRKTFSMTMIIYGIIAVLILILAETIGLWFLNNKMIIPADRLEAVQWVYQFSILSFMMTMITIPYNAVIIARERMRVYAYVSIIEAVLKLLIVYLLVLFSLDKLKLYAVLMFVVTTLITLIYRMYCLRRFHECKFYFYWDKRLFKEIIGYSGWNLFGAIASIFNNHGINIILNLFFGPTVNTARAIAYRINSTMSQFVLNFMTASRPQITKYYATGEKDKMLALVFQTSKFCFILMFMLSIPLLLETNFVLEVWLKQVPEYVVLFTRLIIVATLIDSLSYPLTTAALATGEIKIYQLVVGGILILVLPISYMFLKLGFPPQSVFYLAIVGSVIAMALRLVMLRKMVALNITRYFLQVVIPILLVLVPSYIVPLFVIQEIQAGLLRFFVTTLVGLASSVLSVYLFALSKDEKRFVVNFIGNKVNAIMTLIKR